MKSFTNGWITSLAIGWSIVGHALTALALETKPVQRFHTVTLTWEGPDSGELAEQNPFTDFRLDVTFRHADSGDQFVVPGFYAADGNAAETSAESGNRWVVRFNPDRTGRWAYSAAFRSGPGVAIDANADRGKAITLAQSEGVFDVIESDKQRPDFRAEGQLRYVKERYLRFSGSGRPFLKAGTDSPETLLGYHDFDGTYHDTEKHPVPAPHDPIVLPSLDKGLHRYLPHVGDWREGDPTWKGGLGKGLIGGINYLSQQGVNSIYFLTLNVNGDGRNVWPWIGPWQHDRFDCSKLDQWEVVFQHMQSRGLQLHVVLQETENDHMLDQGDLGPSRRLYLREMVARFSHHNALVWNLGEENTQTTSQQTGMADYIRELDPYDHPIVIHNDHWSPRNLRDTFSPLLGKSTLDGTAIQDFYWNDVHAQVKHFVSASRRAGKPWVVCTDEMGGANYGLKTDQEDPEHYDPRSKGLWGNLMGGGAGVEWYFGWQNNSPHSDLSAEDWRPRQAMWRQSKLAIDFFETYLPFDQMQAADHLALAYADYGLAKAGEVYCVYLFSGGNTRLDLEKHRGPFSVRWFDPRNGGPLQRGSVDHVHGPSWVHLGEPPHDGDRDWVVLVKKVEPIAGPSDAGVIAVEAEHFVDQRAGEKRRWYVLEKSGSLPDLDGAGPATTWVRSNLSASKTSSGHQFVRCLPDTRQSHDDPLVHGENFSKEPGKMAILDYRVHVDQPGRYYVWVRAFSRNTEDNGVHVGLDGTWPKSGRRMQWSQGKHKWTWNCAQRTDQVHSGVPMQIWLDIDTPGEHTVHFSMREDGFTMDKFLLVRDREYRPVGEAARESLLEQDMRIRRPELPSATP